MQGHNVEHNTRKFGGNRTMIRRVIVDIKYLFRVYLVPLRHSITLKTVKLCENGTTYFYIRDPPNPELVVYTYFEPFSTTKFTMIVVK